MATESLPLAPSLIVSTVRQKIANVDKLAMKLRPRIIHGTVEMLDDTSIDLSSRAPRLVLLETCDAAEPAEKDASGVVTEVAPSLCGASGRGLSSPLRPPRRWPR